MYIRYNASHAADLLSEATQIEFQPGSIHLHSWFISVSLGMAGYNTFPPHLSI
jgi:6-pyruvoyl-tetrahydropterin synthase